MKRGKHHIEALGALMLFAVFALCILAVLLSGSEVFSRIEARDDLAFHRRTAEGYLSTKLRSGDRAGAVSLEGDCLILREAEGYETRIYCHEGYLCELFTRSGLSMDPEDGERLLRLEGMEPDMDSGLLRIELKTGGGVSTLLYSLRSGEEVLP